MDSETICRGIHFETTSVHEWVASMVLLTLTPWPSSGGRTVPIPSTALNEPFV